MKKTSIDIFAVIIRQPFEYARFRLLGRELSEYAEHNLKALPHLVTDCEKNLQIPDNFGYLAVLYSDMPLITIDILREAAAFMEAHCVKKIALGRGFMITPDGIDKKLPPYNLNISDFLSVNDTIGLKVVYNEMRKRIIAEHIKNGVIILDDDAVIDDTVVLERGAVIEGGSRITGNSVIKEGAVIKSSRIEDSVIGRNTTVGPFSYIRLDSVIGDNARIGDFVEVKKSRLGAGVKAAHLSYIGDAEVGADTNIGCGTVFCNYDGKHKHQTAVGNNVFIGANTNLVAPVEVGNGVFIAAGTTVTRDLPDDTFCIGRVKQNVKPKRK